MSRRSPECSQSLRSSCRARAKGNRRDPFHRLSASKLLQCMSLFLADFVVKVGIRTARDDRCHLLKPSVATRWIVRGGLRSTLLTLATLRRARRGEWWWPGDQLGKPAKVLRNRCQRELELGTAWPAQSQPAEP